MVFSCSEALVHRVGDGDENGLKREVLVWLQFIRPLG